MTYNMSTVLSACVIAIAFMLLVVYRSDELDKLQNEQTELVLEDAHIVEKYINTSVAGFQGSTSDYVYTYYLCVIEDVLKTTDCIKTIEVTEELYNKVQVGDIIRTYEGCYDVRCVPINQLLREIVAVA